VPTQRGNVLVLTLLSGVLIACGLFFAPPQLGGSTTYTSTVGDSMQPLFHKGDLALTRQASSYRVGDIVLYQSPVLHRPVLHRIIAIQDSHYFFKGDHNDFVDPGYATRAELVGKLWLHVPHAGMALGWLGKPSHAAALAGLITAFLLLGGSRSVRRRRRSRRRNRREGHRMKWRPHSPRRSLDNVLLLAALALGALLTASGFTTPVARTAAVQNAYRHSGVFSYDAPATRPTTAYPSGMATTGQPLFLGNLKQIDFAFSYRFRSNLPHQIHGTIALKASVSSDSTWHGNFPLQTATAFTGDSAVARGMVPVAQVRTFLTQLSLESGVPNASYSVTLAPTVHVRGTVGGRRIDETFTPSLPFTATTTALKLDVSAPAPPPGATYATESPGAAISTALHPVVPGSVPGRVPRIVSFSRLHLAVSTARGLGLGLLALAALILLLKPLKPRRELWSEERRIAFRRGVVIVDVVALRAMDGETAAVDFENLALLAQYCERPIFKAVADGCETFAVEDGGRLYVYRKPESRPAALGVPAPEPRIRRTRRRALRPLFLVLGAVVVILAVGTSFTAATVVPQTSMGVSQQTLDQQQLAPSQCSRSVTHVIDVPSGGAPFVVATGNNLIIGTSGNDNVTAKTGYNCFVGGGPVSKNKDQFTGGAGNGSECIVAGMDPSTNITNCGIVSRSP
jgi:signal peptidase I